MNEEKYVNCIVCPIGCRIFVKYNDNVFEDFNGHKCKKGIEYAKNEIVNPCRILTSSILVKDGIWPLVSIKSSGPIPKYKLFIALDEIKKSSIKAPVKSGQIIIKNVVNSKVDIIATKSVEHV